MRAEERKEAIRGNEEEVNKDYIFIFMDEFICKPMKNQIEDIIQCQRNLQEMHLQSQRQLSDLELRIDNTNVNTEAQLNKLKG